MLCNFYAQPYSFSAGAGHAGVPLVLEFDFQNKPARSTVAEVYAQVVSDLNQAVTLITVSENAGYFSKQLLKHFYQGFICIWKIGLMLKQKQQV